MVLFIQPCKDQPRKDHPTDEMDYADSCGPSTTMRDIESTNGVLLRRDSGVSVGQNETEEPDRYATVGTSPGAVPPLPVDSRVQYQEIDIRTTHVS